MYLNTVPFGGESIVGIKSASRTFFNTTPDSLNIEQAAILVGMLKAPTAYNPRINPERAPCTEKYSDQPDGEIWLS